MSDLLRVLIVDDEPSIREALSLGLKYDGHAVDVTADGQTAIDLSEERQWDMVFVDLCLPDMSGLEVIQRLKKNSPDSIPILITGSGSMETTVEAIRLDVYDYLEKPLRLADVRSAMARGLQRRSSQRKRILKKVPMIVHQISNPLAIITGNAELVLDSVKDEGAVRECMEDIMEAAVRIDRINREIMDLGRSQEKMTEEVDLRTVLEKSVSMYARLLELKGISLRMDLDGIEKNLRGNSFQLEQVFKNLILNAIDSMEGGNSRRLTVAACAGKDCPSATVLIEDTGYGIPPDNIEKIFKPYVTTKGRGTGLGLHVVKSIVEQHGGGVIVNSRQGEGSAFTVILPLCGEGNNNEGGEHGRDALQSQHFNK